jgi:hypothetical protein
MLSEECPMCYWITWEAICCFVCVCCLIFLVVSYVLVDGLNAWPECFVDHRCGLSASVVCLYGSNVCCGSWQLVCIVIFCDMEWMCDVILR